MRTETATPQERILTAAYALLCAATATAAMAADYDEASPWLAFIAVAALAGASVYFTRMATRVLSERALVAIGVPTLIWAIVLGVGAVALASALIGEFIGGTISTWWVAIQAALGAAFGRACWLHERAYPRDARRASDLAARSFVPVLAVVTLALIRAAWPIAVADIPIVLLVFAIVMVVLLLPHLILASLGAVLVRGVERAPLTTPADRS